MANFCRNLFQTVLVLSIIVYCKGEPTSCYYCNTDADGEACNTPLNKTAVRIQYCSNLTLADNGATLNGLSSAKADGVPSVCSTMTYISQARHLVTIRDCQSAELFNKEVCSYLKQEVPNAGVTDFTCRVCDSDLCNTSSSVYISIVVLISSVIIKSLF